MQWESNAITCDQEECVPIPVDIGKGQKTNYLLCDLLCEMHEQEPDKI